MLLPPLELKLPIVPLVEEVVVDEPLVEKEVVVDEPLVVSPPAPVVDPAVVVLPAPLAVTPLVSFVALPGDPSEPPAQAAAATSCNASVAASDQGWRPLWARLLGSVL